MQTKEEVAWFKENGLAHPQFAMISGGQRDESMLETPNE